MQRRFQRICPIKSIYISKKQINLMASGQLLPSSLQGLAVELQVSDRDEITQTEIHDHVLSVLTRK